jgi:hypothetical protein
MGVPWHEICSSKLPEFAKPYNLVDKTSSKARGYIVYSTNLIERDN